MRINNVIKRPIVTEKSMGLSAQMNANVYVFEVDRKASKGSVANEFARLFDAEVLQVKTMIIPGKKRRIGKSAKFRRTAGWKKAVIYIKGDKKLDIYAEGK